MRCECVRYRAFPQDEGSQGDQTQLGGHDDVPLLQIGGRHQLVVVDVSVFDVRHVHLHRVPQGQSGQFLHVFRQRGRYHHSLTSIKTALIAVVLLHDRHYSVQQVELINLKISLFFFFFEFCIDCNSKMFVFF